MSDLNIIPDGALLIRDGVIEEVGTTRRIENLVPARLAREYDASGKVVMPAFVDPDVGIAAPVAGSHAGYQNDETDIRRMSRRRLENHALATAADLARYGVLTVGAHTLSAPDLPNTLKALKLHQALQSKPLRIRSVFSPPCVDRRRGESRTDNDLSSEQIRHHCERLARAWMPAIIRRKLASLLELSIVPERIEQARALAAAAAEIGYNIRFRVSGLSTPEVLELAYSAGIVALIGQIAINSAISRALADGGCVNVVLVSRIFDGQAFSKRAAINDGTPIALASGYRRDNTASVNSQFMLYLACQNLGMTIEEALVATTYNAACSLRLSHVTGSLAPGKAADLCVMDVDDYHELSRRAGHHDASLVMRAGKVIYRRPNLNQD
jgi:imidazolonepropionase